MEKVQVQTAPGRLISAVARIGYDTEVALCDLLDNSVDAGSTKIEVNLEAYFDDESGHTDTIAKYVISDNGSGMDKQTLLEAFTLGSRRDYPANSLGKFGLGMKSAGLSLGNCIVLLTKEKEADTAICGILSLDHVHEVGEYEIDFGEIPDDYQSYWGDRPNGTVLIIQELAEGQPALKRFEIYLRRYIGIVFHQFLEGQDPLDEIVVNDIAVSPIDPLFLSEASENGGLGNPEDWDGKHACLLVENTKFGLRENINCSVAATHLVHPPSFEVEGRRKEILDKYHIGTDPYNRKARHGFFIYRNRRVVVMAERFHGVISAQTQAWAFRGRLMFDSSADTILSLDVKKVHCRLPNEVRSNLRAMITNHHQKSVRAWQAAGRRVQQERGDRKTEIANESIARTPVLDLRYAPGTELSNQAAIDTRERLMNEVESDTLASIVDSEVSREFLEKEAEKGSAVIPTEGLKGNAMWLPFPATKLGAAETLLNQTHSWIAEAYAVAEEDAKITLILHQLFTILGRAELEVRSVAWNDVASDATGKIIERFRRKASAIGEDLAETLAAELERQSGEGETE